MAYAFHPLLRQAALVATLSLAGCGGGDANTAGDPVVASQTATSVAAIRVTATPTPTPTPTPSSSQVEARSQGGSILAPSLDGLAPVASGIKVDDYLVKSWGTGAIPASMKPDVVGAFRFQCAPSHNAYDDPIVFPGQPGKSHLHTFFGNTLTNSNSTYQSLRTSGDSTCNNVLNRSAYWMPAVMNGHGKVVMPDFAAIYYKRLPSNDPQCKVQGVACIAMPRGLRFVFGYNMSNPANSGSFYWDCYGPGAVEGHFPNIAQAAKGCPAGARLGAVISAPSCWNGKELDSPDHRSHMAYPSYGSWGYLKCPADHPYIVPTFTLGAWFTPDTTLDRSGNEAVDANTWYLSSDRMPGMAAAVPGTTFHSDWFGGWEDSIMSIWTANCIDKLLSCSGGDLGQGQQLKTLYGYTNVTKTTLVDPPPHP